MRYMDIVHKYNNTNGERFAPDSIEKKQISQFKFIQCELRRISGKINQEPYKFRRDIESVMVLLRRTQKNAIESALGKNGKTVTEDINQVCKEALEALRTIYCEKQAGEAGA